MRALPCFAFVVACSPLACSSNGGGSDAGVDVVVTRPACDAGASGALAGFCAPSDPGAGGVLFSASGEALALTGYPFPPVSADDPAFVDGWDVKFQRLLVTVDKITLSQNPDTNPGDESQTGAEIAEVDGPWAIDLAHADPSYLPGKGGGGEEAVPIASLGGQGFATDGTRYAFGFDLIAATNQTSDGRATMNVNLDADGLADYANMVTKGCAVEYIGTATFKGDQGPMPTCNADPEYASWPKTIAFDLCFPSPTTYVNCQNPDNDPAKSLPNEEHERGIAFLSDRSVIAQITVHTDHPFWDSVLHDSPAHFDQFAARASGQLDAGTPLVTLDAMRGVDYTAVTDAQGNVLKWRYCIAPPTDVHPQFDGIMSFDPQSVPLAFSGDPSTGLRDYADFSTYDQSTQGHLNSDGLCFVRRNYPSPP
jgi:hypothetical protein